MTFISIEKYQDYKSWMVIFRAGLLILTGVLELAALYWMDEVPMTVLISCLVATVLSIFLGITKLIPHLGYRIREIWWLVPAVLHPVSSIISAQNGFVFPIANILAIGVLGHFWVRTTYYESWYKVGLGVFISSYVVLFSLGVITTVEVFMVWYVQLMGWGTFLVVLGLFVWSIEQEAKFSRRDALQNEFIGQSLAQLRSTTLNQVKIPFEELKQEYIIQNAFTEMPKVLGEKMRNLDYGIGMLSRLHQEMEAISMNTMVKMLYAEFKQLKIKVEVFRNDKNEDFANVYRVLQAFLQNSNHSDKNPELEIIENALGKVFVLKCYGLGLPSDWMENIESIKVGQDVKFNMAIWIQLLTAQGFYVGISSESGVGRTIAFAKNDSLVWNKINTSIPCRFFEAKLAPILD